MKRILTCMMACLFLALLLGLAACGKSPEEKWQEQYELGMKYVSEGNYEEAVLAFTAAIEIDPKSADAYLALADVYETQGDTESLQAILEQGLEATGVERFQERLDALLEETSREAPEPLNAYMSSNEFAEATPELEALLKLAVQTGLSGSWEGLNELLWTEELLSCVRELEGAFVMSDEAGTEEYLRFWTITDEDTLIYYFYTFHSEGSTVGRVEMQYRSRNGDGFTYSYSEFLEGYHESYVKGSFSEYLFQGSFTECQKLLNSHENWSSITEGNAEGEFLQGEIKTIYEGHNDISEEYFQYENGRIQTPWTDEDGNRCVSRIIRTDGTEAFSPAETYGLLNDWFTPGGRISGDDYTPGQE